MEMTKCEKSSQVSEYGYDASSQVLRVCFKSGGIYDYGNQETPVPADVFERMKGAESVGKFLGTEIKGKFPFVRIPTPKDEKRDQEAA